MLTEQYGRRLLHRQKDRAEKNCKVKRFHMNW